MKNTIRYGVPLDHIHETTLSAGNAVRRKERPLVAAFVAGAVVGALAASMFYSATARGDEFSIRELIARQEVATDYAQKCKINIQVFDSMESDACRKMISAANALQPVRDWWLSFSTDEAVAQGKSEGVTVYEFEMLTRKINRYNGSIKYITAWMEMQK